MTLKLVSQVDAKFTVVVDTREQTPWAFEGITTRLKKATVDVIVPTTTKKLATGDYSIQGYEQSIAIERKSTEDLISTVAHGRERFIRELTRLNAMEWGCVIVEDEWKDVMIHCAQRTGYSPVSLDSSILAWQQRFRGVHWLFRPGRFAATKTAYKILDRFYRDKNSLS